MKQNFSLLMHPETHRRLKVFSAENGLTMAEGIHLLLDRHENEQRRNLNTVVSFLRGGIDLDELERNKHHVD